MTLYDSEEMTRSSKHWREGVLGLLNTLYAIMDFSILERDQHVQRWLFNTGHTWVGDPDEPQVFASVPLHRLYVQNKKWVAKALASIRKDETRLSNFLEYRDRLMRGTQELLVTKPEVLYLLCMHVEIRLKESADVQSVNLNAPPQENSVFVLYADSVQARELLCTIYPRLEKPPGEWRKEYLKKL